MKFTIFHTNDVHSHLNEYVRIITYMAEHRPELQHPSLYLGIGDYADLSTPATEATMGKKDVELLNEAHCDTATIGNNEGVTISHESLSNLYNDVQFKVICANVSDGDGHLPHHITTSYIKEIEDVRFSFVTATAPFMPFYRVLDWIATDPLGAIKDEIEQRKGRYDVLVAMSHIGVFFDEKLCQEIPEIDAILGSHTYHHFNHGEVNNDVLMAVAGKHGYYLGEVSLTIENKTVITKEATLYSVDALSVIKIHFNEEGRNLINRAIINKPVSLFSKTNVITKTTYLPVGSMHEFTNADCTIINAGLIVNSIEGDQLTGYDIHTTLPHSINLVRIRLKGSESKKAILKSQKQEYIHEHIQGLGFRGDIFGGYILYKCEFIQSEHRFFVDGQETEDNRTYVLGIVDMYTFGRCFLLLKGTSIDYLMPEFLRDIFKERLIQTHHSS